MLPFNEKYGEVQDTEMDFTENNNNLSLKTEEVKTFDPLDVIFCLENHIEILNGNSITLPGIIYENKMVKVNNTCPLDSILELMIDCILNRKTFQNLFLYGDYDEQNMNIFNILYFYALKKCDISYIYQRRFEIFLEILGRDKIINNSLDCKFSVTKIF